MQDLSELPTDTMQQRKRAILSVCCVILALSVMAYFTGGKQRRDEGVVSEGETAIRRETGGSQPVEISGQDDLFPTIPNDGDTVEISESTNTHPVTETGDARHANTASNPRHATGSSPKIARETLRDPTNDPSQSRFHPSIESETITGDLSRQPLVDGSPSAIAKRGLGSSKLSDSEPAPLRDTPKHTKTDGVDDPARRIPAGIAVSGTATSVSSGPVAKPKLVLKSPKTPVYGIVAQTETVISELEFNSAPVPLSAQQDGGMLTKPRAAKVTKAQAQTFAQDITAEWKSQGRIPPTQRLRLPKQCETSNTRIWREEDEPGTAAERRTFGMVLSDDSAPSTSKVTPEGIPVRSVPVGQSALEKSVPDRPLWKRPQ